MSEAETEWPDKYLEASEAVKDCAESVAADNPDLSKSQAFAICQDMENEGKLAAASESDREASPMQPLFRSLSDHPMDPPGAIRREETDDGVRYSNILILAPGEWTDGATGETLFYSPDLTEHIAAEPAERVPERNGRTQNIVNFDHNKQEQLAEVGHFDVDSLARDEHGNLYADVVLWNDTTMSQDAVALMDRALETEGQQGAGGFSVEIPFENEVTEFDNDRGMEAMVAGDLAGLAIARESASAPAATAQQFADRAIALSASDDPSHLYVGDRLTEGSRHGSRMRIEDADDLERALADADDGVEIEITGDSVEEIANAINGDGTDTADGESESDGPDTDAEADDGEGADGEKALAGEGEAAAVVDEYLANEGSPEDGVDAMLEWARANTDVDIDALESLAADYLAESEADDLSETPVSEFMAFLEEMATDEGDEEDSDDEEESEMAEQLADMEETIRELRAEVDELRDEDGPRTMSARATPDDEEDRPPAAPTKGGFSSTPTRDGGEWISR